MMIDDVVNISVEINKDTYCAHKNLSDAIDHVINILKCEESDYKKITKDVIDKECLESYLESILELKEVMSTIIASSIVRVI